MLSVSRSFSKLQHLTQLRSYQPCFPICIYSSRSGAVPKKKNVNVHEFCCSGSDSKHVRKLIWDFFFVGLGGLGGELFSLSNMPSQEEPMPSSIYRDALLATHPQVKFEAWPSGV